MLKNTCPPPTEPSTLDSWQHSTHSLPATLHSSTMAAAGALALPSGGPHLDKAVLLRAETDQLLASLQPACLPLMRSVASKGCSSTDLQKGSIPPATPTPIHVSLFTHTLDCDATFSPNQPPQPWPRQVFVRLVLPAASSAQILPGVLSVATTVTVFLDSPPRARWTLPSAHCSSAHTTQPQTNLPDCQPRLDCQASPRGPAVPHCASFLSFVAVRMSRGC